METTVEKIKRQLLKDLKAAGKKNAVTIDLVDQYIDARVNEDPVAMAAILNALQISPKTKRRQELETSIRDQLQIKGLSGPIFEDRIDSFLRIWDAFQEANRHLNERGRTYEAVSSAGKLYEKDNAASKDIVSMAKAMQDALDWLGVTVEGFADPEDDEL